ncbi:MAG: rhomboid family intramembrane serine protease [Clostridiales bacterium]|nr:rhomboid family intramembrane serine protease [Clostridiales bacterium]
MITRFLNTLEQKMGRHYIPDLMKYLCLGMLGVFVLDYLPFGISASSLLYFNRSLILQGQVWRLFTFVFLPPDSSILFILFSLYFYYMLGTMLENRWGSRRFNLYYLIGVLGSILGGFVTGYATNYYLNMSLFLAIAVLYGEMQLNLFMVLPIKMKYLAWVDAALLIYSFLFGSWPSRIALLLSLAPFFLFFGRNAYLAARHDWWKLRNWWNNRKR